METYKPQLPTLLLLGAFHGDQVTGAIGILHFMQMYMDNNIYRNRTNLIAMPISNPQGYTIKTRKYKIKDGVWIDPNRDFPFDNSNSTCCLTNLCKNLFSIYDKYKISMTITFHSGQQSITYPPGDTKHKSQTPDNKQYQQITQFINNKLAVKNFYQTGKMKDVVYAVKGGFQDWAYYWGWDNKGQKSTCLDQSLINNKVVMSGLVFLVQNNKQKGPKSNWGSSLYFKKRNKLQYGHVPRVIQIIESGISWLSPQLNVIRNKKQMILSVSCPRASVQFQDKKLQFKKLNQQIRLEVKQIQSVQIKCIPYQKSHSNINQYWSNNIYHTINLNNNTYINNTQDNHYFKWIYILVIGFIIIILLKYLHIRRTFHSNSNAIPSQQNII